MLLATFASAQSLPMGSRGELCADAWPTHQAAPGRACCGHRKAASAVAWVGLADVTKQLPCMEPAFKRKGMAQGTALLAPMLACQALRISSPRRSLSTAARSPGLSYYYNATFPAVFLKASCGRLRVLSVNYLPYLPYPTLPYPTLPYPTLPYPTLLYSTLHPVVQIRTHQLII